MSADSWKKERKIVRLSNFKESPKTVLASSLEKSDYMESVIVIIKWKSDKSVVIDQSTQKLSDMLMAHRILDYSIDDIIQ